jgi:hypothetical protein
MIVPFEQLPEQSRIWIYPSNRPFSDEEVPKLKEAITTFLNQWTAHSQMLEAAFDLPYNRFIVIGINQEKVSASGCSIDTSVRFIQDLERQFEVDLLDKMNVTFRQGDYFAHKTLTDFKALAKAKSISKNTIVFNNLVDTKYDYQQFWEIPASESWHNRFIK